MRLLAISDIHNNLVAVRRMRASEKNDFDAVVVAGDLGNAGAAEVLKILATFQCPVVHVYGNWDGELPYETALAPGTSLIHLNVATIDGLHFTGFSGCPTKWGRNPAALKIGNQPDADAKILQQNRNALKKVIASSKLDPRRTVIVTHERLARLGEIAASPLLHLYGHTHGFSQRLSGETHFVNVSVLDKPVTARPRRKDPWTRDDLRNFNAGTYTIIEISLPDSVTIKSVTLPHDYPEWIALEDRRHNGIDWIAEEQEWTDPADPRLARYQQSF